MCGNSLKFTTKGYVKVFCTYEELTDEYVGIKLEVSDSGWEYTDFLIFSIGIPHEKLSVIFEDFEQVESTLSNTVQGAGTIFNQVNKIKVLD